MTGPINLHQKPKHRVYIRQKDEASASSDATKTVVQSNLDISNSDISNYA